MGEKQFSEMTQEELLRYIHATYADMMVAAHGIKQLLNLEGRAMGYHLCDLEAQIVAAGSQGQAACDHFRRAYFPHALP